MAATPAPVPPLSCVRYCGSRCTPSRGNWRALRRSLLTCAPDGPATSLTNRDASQLTSPVQAMEEELEMLRSGVAALFHDTTPVPPAPTHSCDASALIWDAFWRLRA